MDVLESRADEMEGYEEAEGYAWCEAPSPWSRVASSSVERGSSGLGGVGV